MQLFTGKIIYLGHCKRAGKLQLLDHITVVVVDLKATCNGTELDLVLKLWNLYRLLVARFPHIAALLSKNIKKDEPRKVGPVTLEGHNTLAILQDSPVSASVIPLPHRNRDIALESEACENPIGCDLMQKQEDGTKIPLRNWSIPLIRKSRAPMPHMECVWLCFGLFAITTKF